MSIASIVSLVGGKLSELLVQEAKLLYGVEDQVRSLQEELIMMNSFFIDMEARDEEEGDELSRTTIRQMRKIAYDAEDVIDSYIFEANIGTDKMGGFLKRYACFCSYLTKTHQVGSEIESIIDRITKTMARWEKYVGPNGGVRTDSRAGLNRVSRRRIRRIAYPHTEEEHVVGLEEDINKLVWMMTTDTGTKIQVVSIVGMGGSGKTTLARKLYNHASVKKHFDCIAWVSISQDWVAQQILLELWRIASGGTTRKEEKQERIQESKYAAEEKGWSLEALVEKLHQYLESKRYLIVLDDVWTNQALVEIFPALPNDGRKIIITTRRREIIDFPLLNCSIHEPRRLTTVESWELFRNIALLRRDESWSYVDVNVLETLGKEMLNKCEGLPLAVIALAGILANKETLEQWENVKKAVSSRIMEEDRGSHLYGPVNEMLSLSYDDLSHELKPCFLYLAMFPEDAEIPIGRLIRMWIAERFIVSDMSNAGATVEDVARQYLQELIDRCVVQKARTNYTGKLKSIRVHDLVRDLCIRKAKQQNFLHIFTSQSSNSDATVTDLRRTANYCLDKPYSPFPTQSHHLRSLVYQVIGPNIHGDHQKLSLKHIHENFRLLRVLFLENVQISGDTLPTGIGNLIHLRYLRLWYTNITQLPSSVGNLRNLLTLECRNIGGLKHFPDVLWKIKGLRHLNLSYQGSVKGRVKLHTLQHLQKLKGIWGGSWMLEELPRLSPTVEKLNITNISSEEQLKAALTCPSIVSDNLHSLSLGWNVDPGKGKVVVLENLQPLIHCKYLRKVYLVGRIQKSTLTSSNKFPTSIVKLVLRLTGFVNEAELAALGELPNLTFLWLYPYSYNGGKWNVTAGQFKQLKELRLSLYSLEEWSIETGAMRQLRRLNLTTCDELRRLPEGLKYITTLKELQATAMGDEFKKRLKGGGEDAHIIQHVPAVHIL